MFADASITAVSKFCTPGSRPSQRDAEILCLNGFLSRRLSVYFAGAIAVQLDPAYNRSEAGRTASKSQATSSGKQKGELTSGSC